MYGNLRPSDAGIIYRRIRVQSDCDHCSVWNPLTSDSRATIEMVQRQSARYDCNRYRNTSSVSYMLNTLNWSLLSEQRLCTRLMMYKITHHFVLYSSNLGISTKLIFKLIQQILHPVYYFSMDLTTSRCSSVSQSIPPGIFMVVIVGQLDLQLPVQSVHIATKALSSNPVHGEVYSIQHYVIKFFSDLRQVGGFTPVSSTNKI